MERILLAGEEPAGAPASVELFVALDGAGELARRSAFALVSELRSVYLPLSLRVDTMRSHCKGNSWGRNASAFCVSHTTQSNCVLPFPRLAFFLKGRHDGLLRPC